MSIIVYSVLAFLATCAPSYASLTLINWRNQTGKGTDAPSYSNPTNRGRYNGEALYVNDGDPCIYSQKNIHRQSGDIERGVRRCIGANEEMKNPVKRGIFTIPGDRRRVQSPGVDPVDAVKFRPSR